MLTKNALSWMSEYLSDRLGLVVHVALCANGYLLKSDLVDFILPRSIDSEKQVKFFRFNSSHISSNIARKRIYGYEVPSMPKNYIECEVSENNLDIITFMFDHLNRVEEIGNKSFDQHGRFQLKDSLAYHVGYYDEPVVDHIVEYLKGLFVRFGLEIIEKSETTILITHDVDSAYRYDFTSYVGLARFFVSRFIKGDLKSLHAYILFLLSKVDDPYDTFDFLMDVSEKYNTRSNFFFIPDQNSLRWDGNYTLHSKKIGNLLKKILNRGHHIGTHFSYYSYNDPSRIKGEYELLFQKCQKDGYQSSFIPISRMHYLRWSSWKTAKALVSAGVTIDTSMGYAERLSFRSGTCHPYYPFCTEDDCKVPLKIIPLTIMEGTVWGENYMNITSPDEIITTMKKQIDKVKEVRGTINILWHNSDLDESWKKRVYTEIVKYATDK